MNKELEYDKFISLLSEFQLKNPKELILNIKETSFEDRYKEGKIELLVSDLFREYFEMRYPEKDFDLSLDNYIEKKFLGTI